MVLRQSSLIETEPWGFQSPNKFLNAVILCETERTPREVLRLTQKIERDMGRKKPIGGQSPRDSTKTVLSTSTSFSMTTSLSTSLT